MKDLPFLQGCQAFLLFVRLVGWLFFIPILSMLFCFLYFSPFLLTCQMPQCKTTVVLKIISLHCVLPFANIFKPTFKTKIKSPCFFPTYSRNFCNYQFCFKDLTGFNFFIFNLFYLYFFSKKKKDFCTSVAGLK